MNHTQTAKLKKVTNINLKDNRALYVIPYGEQSPLENHNAMVVAHDNLKDFYVHEIFLVTYGALSIEKAINKAL